MNKILIVCLFSIVTAEISNDSLSVLINEGKVQILDEVTYVDPLVGKKMGVEINPLYTMVYDEDFNFSGTFSLFPKGQNAEIAFAAKTARLKLKSESEAVLNPSDSSKNQSTVASKTLPRTNASINTPKRSKKAIAMILRPSTCNLAFNIRDGLTSRSIIILAPTFYGAPIQQSER